MTDGRTCEHGFICAALVVALLFDAVFPIPYGVKAVDDFRVQRAEAIAPAVAVPVIVATALAAGGVYVGGVTLSEYDGNLSAVSDAFLSWCGENLYHDDVDAASAALSSAVESAGNIDFSVLAASGILSLIPAFAQSLVDGGSAAVSESSICSTSAVSIGGQKFLRWSSVPQVYFDMASAKVSQIYENGFTELIAYQLTTDDDGYVNLFGWYRKPDNVNWRFNGSALSLNSVQRFQLQRASAGASANVWGPYNVSFSMYSVSSGQDIVNYLKLAPSVAVSVTGYEVDNDSSVINDVSATVSQAVLDNSLAAPSSGVYQPFSPTADQLASGYDSTAVLEAEIADQGATIAELQERIDAQAQSLSAVNTRVGTLEGSVEGLQTDVGALQSDVDAIGLTLELMPELLQGILDAVNPLGNGLSGILAALNPLTAILSGVNALVAYVNALVDAPFGWLQSWWDTLSGWWSSLLSMLGNVPLATLLGPLSGVVGILDTITGWGLRDWLGTTSIGDLVGGVATGVAGVGSQVGTLVGDLTGWWDDLLDWLGDTSIGALVGSILRAIEGLLTGEISLSAVLEAIGSIPAALSGALAGALDAAVTFFIGEPVAADPFVSDSGKVRGFGEQLRDKAPWAYVLALNDAFAGVSASYAVEPSFYVDLPLFMAGDIRFDAGSFLLLGVNGFTIAALIRVLVTSAICVSLLMLAYKAMERVVSSEG